MGNILFSTFVSQLLFLLKLSSFFRKTGKEMKKKAELLPLPVFWFPFLPLCPFFGFRFSHFASPILPQNLSVGAIRELGAFWGSGQRRRVRDSWPLHFFCGQTFSKPAAAHPRNFPQSPLPNLPSSSSTLDFSNADFPPESSLSHPFQVAWDLLEKFFRAHRGAVSRGI